MPKKINSAASDKAASKIADGSKKIGKKNSAAAEKADKAEEGQKFLELALLLDCTGSMASWIERAKTTLQEIIENVAASCDGKLDVKVCFVGYRDHCDRTRFTIQPFSGDIAKVKKFIAGVRADGGGDFPEDVTGGLRQCLD